MGPTAKQKLSKAITTPSTTGDDIADAIEFMIKTEFAKRDMIAHQNMSWSVSTELQEIQSKGRLIATIQDLRNQIQSLKDQLKEANEALQNRFTRCTYCGFRIDYFSEDGHDKALEEMRQHALVCKQDPHVQEIAKLKEELAEWKRHVDMRWHDGYETGFLKAKESDTVSNVSKPIITRIPEGWESAMFSKPDTNRSVRLRNKIGNEGKAFFNYSYRKWMWISMQNTLLFTEVIEPLCWKELD